MKKLIALVIAAIMVLSMIPVMTFTSSAAEVEGDWTVYRDPEKYEVEEGEAIRPDPGYEYTDEGFTTIAPDWTNYTPFFTVQTKDPKPLKEGFYMQVRMDEYAYGGENGVADHWICFNISDRPGINPGGVDFSNNWVSLIRGNGDGSAQCASCLTTMTTEEKMGSFANQFQSSITAPIDDQGREIYTFEINWDGSAYELKVNGVVFSNSTISDALKTWIETGEYYVGVTLHSGVANATQKITILKHGTSEADAITPVGSDSLTPEASTLVFGDKIDASTVETNTPALMWDATMSTFLKEPKGTDVKLVAQGDNSYHVIASGASPYWTWNIKHNLTYSVSDFPVFCMVLRNFWGDRGGFFYCAGDIISANNDCYKSWTLFDEGCLTFIDEDNEYSLVVIDLSEDLAEALTSGDGRIHSLRPTFSVTDTSDPEVAEWDVCYMGMFRSVEEAQQYAINRLDMTPIDEPDWDIGLDTNAPDTNVDPETQEPGNENPDTNAPTTDAPETDAPETNGTADTSVSVSETTGDTGDSTTGCNSVIGFSTVAILAAAAAAVALKKKN